MKIIDIDIDNKLILKFIYRDKPYSMIVDIIAKNNKYIIIPSLLENKQALSPDKITEVELIYTVKDGIFSFKNLTIEASLFQSMRVYQVSSEEEVNRTNRREAYRVFIGELVKIAVQTEAGKKKEYDGILKDISVLGMGIILKNELELGSVISIIYNYEGLNIHLLGKVIRKDKMSRYRAFTYGCIFNEPNNGINRIVTMKQIKS